MADYLGDQKPTQPPSKPQSKITKTQTEDETYSDFTKIVKSTYEKLFYEAGVLCGEGATVKDKHITTMGLIHDYFNYRK